MTVFDLGFWAKNRRLLLIGLIGLTGNPPVLAAAAAAKTSSNASAQGVVTLGLIDAESDPKLPSITIRLSQKPTWTTLGAIQNHGAFLQLTLPGTIVPEPGRFYEGVTPFMPKIAAFQLTPSDAGIRFFINQDAAKTKEALSAEVLGDRIVLTIDALKLSAALIDKPASASTDFIEKDLIGPPALTALSADQVIARTAVQKDEPAPSELFKADKGQADKGQGEALATGGLDLRDKMMRMAAFSAVMMGLLLITWMARPYLKKRSLAKGGGDLTAPDNITMKTLASMSLAPRQKISLVQVGSERLLLGISSDQITFLSAIANPNASNHQSPIRAGAPQQRPLPQDFGPEFTKMLTSPGPVEMSPAPVLKKLPGNDPESLAPRRAPRPATPSPHGAPVPGPRPAAATGQRINIGVGEDGIEDMTPRRTRPQPSPEPRVDPVRKSAPPASAYSDTGDGQKAIDDVTRLIREKLKNLRTI